MIMCLFRYERATSTHCLRDLSFPVSVPAAALSACSCGLKSKNSRKTGRKGRRKGEREGEGEKWTITKCGGFHTYRILIDQQYLQDLINRSTLKVKERVSRGSCGDWRWGKAEVRIRVISFYCQALTVIRRKRLV
jgi:hypothetical protein